MSINILQFYIEIIKNILHDFIEICKISNLKLFFLSRALDLLYHLDININTEKLFKEK